MENRGRDIFEYVKSVEVDEDEKWFQIDDI